jgi:ligand-binding sensor domain-containing protein
MFCVKKNITAIVTLALSLLPVSYLDAQYPANKIFSIEETNRTIKISRLFSSRAGWIFAGTNEGLYRFDGSNFKKVVLGDTLKEYPISAISEINNQLWIGLSTGHIYIIENNKAKKYTPQEGVPKVAINDFIEDKNKNIWIATSGEGIYCIKNNKLYNWGTEDGLTDNYVYDLETDDEGNIAAGTDQGISFCHWKGKEKKVTRFTGTDGLPDNIVRVIKHAGSNCFIAGTQDKGLYWLNRNNNAENKTVSPAINTGQVNDISFNNTRFIAATDIGLYSGSVHKNPNAFSVDPLPVTTGNISRALIDKEGNNWVAVENKLVLISSCGAVNLIPPPEVNPKKVHALLFTRSLNGKDFLWAAADKKIIRFGIENNNSKTDKIFHIKEIDEKTEITSLYEDPYKNIWIGTMGKGIFVLNPDNGRYRNINEDSLLYNGSILSIAGRANEIWISSLAGAVKCSLTDNNAVIASKYHFTNYNELSGIGTNYIYTIFVDSKNRVWFGTDGKGIAVYENGVFKNYGKKNGLADEVIYSIAEDSKGNTWFSTSSAGLYKYDGNIFINFSIPEGLSDLSVSSLAADNYGNILITSKKGVDILNTETGLVYNLNREAGIDGTNETLNCITKDAAGNIYFSSANGIFRYNPQENKSHAQVTTVLDEVLLFLQPVEDIAKNNFSYGQNNFTFSFAGLYYTNPDKVQYQYKLEGFNNEWFSTKDRFASFPKLPPGNYTFKVRSSLSNNFAPAMEAAYSFTISKPFWKQWWFLLLSAVILASVLFSIIKYRERELKKWQQLQQEKIQFQFETLKNQVNPHFLFNSFNTLISVIEENPENAVEYVEQLSDFYRTIVTTKENDLIPLEEELTLISNYFFIQKKRYGNSLSYLINLSAEEIKKIQVPPLTLQLLAENAIKHNAISKETPLSFEILKDNQRLVVRNNINKKINKEPGTGIGLPNIINRYQLMSGKEVLIENNNKEFVVSLPIL